MFGRKKEERQVLPEKLNCPYCEASISQDNEPSVIEKEGFLIFGCPRCKKILGITHEF